MAEKPSGPGLFPDFRVMIACRSSVISMGLSISSASEADTHGRPLCAKYCSIIWDLDPTTVAGLCEGGRFTIWCKTYGTPTQFETCGVY